MLPNSRVVRGQGGGAATPSTPLNENNTLRSRSYARVLDMLGWGEWEGLVNGAKSIFLDETPIVSVVDGQDQSNFDGLSWVTVPGTQTQNYIAGFDTVENDFAVGVQIKAIIPVVRTISNHDADKVIITVRIPRLYQQNANGDVTKTGLSIKVSIALNGGAYVDQPDWNWYDKCMSDYFESKEIILPKSVTPDTDTWQIKLSRNTPDSDGSNSLLNIVYWDSYSEVVTQKLTYPNLAMVGLELDAAAFSKIPVRGYEVKMKRIQIPQNYDPVARTYATTGPGTTAGGWDGTFKTAWSNNPAWVFYDLLTNKLYGLGRYINLAYIDKWTLYVIGQYCDVNVPDGFGGVEPRMVCNVYLQTQQDALKVLSDFASVFRAMLYYFNGRIVPVQDAPKSSFLVFTKANVKGGTFQYASTGRRARKTVAMVRYANKLDFYRPAWQPVEDLDGIIRYGYQETEVVAFGCTSKGQAYRYGKYILETEKREYDGISFRTGMDALLLRIGDIFEVQDADRAQAQFGGRVVTGTTTSITLDRPVLIESGKTYQLTLVLPKAVTDVQDVTNSTQTAAMRTSQIETQTASAALGNQTVLTTGAFSVAPPAGSIWVLTSSSLATQKFRVLSIKETDKAEWEISGNAYVVSKFDLTEVNPSFATTPIVRFPVGNRVEPVSHVVGSVRTIAAPDALFQYLDVSWKNEDAFANSFRVLYSHDGGEVTALQPTSVPFVSIPAPVSGLYTVSIFALNSITGATSAKTSYTIKVLGISPLDNIGVFGLELKDLGIITTFSGRDAIFDWRVNSKARTRELGDDTEFGIQ